MLVSYYYSIMYIPPGGNPTSNLGGGGGNSIPEARPGAEVGCPELWVLVLFVQGVHLQSDRMGPAAKKRFRSSALKKYN